MRRAALALAALLLPVPAIAQPVRVGFGEADTLAHRVAGEDVVEGSSGRMFGEVRVRIAVSPAGDVTDAQLLTNEFLVVGADGRETIGHDRPSANPDPALAAAKRWKFRPFTYRAAPVAALGEITIRYREPLMKGEWKDPAAAFPAIDYPTLRITLIRGASYWGSAQYRVTIDGEGNVTFTTDAPTGLDSKNFYWSPYGGSEIAPGTHRSRIGRAALDALIERFRAVRFFGLRPRYEGVVSDQPTQILRFETGASRFELFDYAGGYDGMPGAVDELEAAIDEAAGALRWVRGDAETVRLALAEGLDIHGEAARRMAEWAVMHGYGQVTLDLIDAGLPLETIIDTRSGRPAMPLGAVLLLEAVEEGEAKLFARLADAGWLVRVPSDLLVAAFVHHRGGCEPDIARRIVGAGFDVNLALPARNGWGDAPGQTALIAALDSFRCTTNRSAYVAALLALGADPNKADGNGEAPLFHAEQLDSVEQLLAAGAHAAAKDQEGRSPVFGTYSDAVVRRLLDAGADPGGTDRHGRSLRKIAVEKDWPATLEWLDAKGVP